MFSEFSPGMLVHHPARPDWGRGQVQSAINARVTVNFEHAGKKTIDTAVITLKILSDPDSESGSV